MPGFADKIKNPRQYTWTNEETPEPLFFESPTEKPLKKTKQDWLEERERRIWKKKDPYWSQFRLAKPKQTKISSGKPVPGAWRTANREDGW